MSTLWIKWVIDKSPPSDIPTQDENMHDYEWSLFSYENTKNLNPCLF